MHENILWVELIIVDEAGNVPVPNTLVGPVPNVLHSLFESVNMSWNDVCVSQQTNYAYRAYIANVLSYDQSAKDSHQQAEGDIYESIKYL